MAAQVDKTNSNPQIPSGAQQPVDPSNPAANEFSNKNNNLKQQIRPINLLPEEFKPKKSVLKLSKKMNKAAVIALAVFFVLALTSVGAILLLRNRVSSAQENVENLTQEVAALEQTEQRLILIKDRINKINAIRSDRSSLYSTVKVFKEFNDSLPSGLEVASAEISSREINTVVIFEDSSELARFLAQTVSADKYSLLRINKLELDSDGNLNMSLKLAAS